MRHGARRYDDIALRDVLVKLILVRMVVRRHTDEELVQQGSHAVPVNGLTVRLAGQNLGR